jgi:hypothetical protein
MMMVYQWQEVMINCRNYTISDVYAAALTVTQQQYYQLITH